MLSSAALAVSTMLLLQTQGPVWTMVMESDPSIPAEWKAELADAARGEINLGEVAGANRSDLQIVLGCSAWDASCAAKAAELLNADRVLSVEVTPHGGGAWLSYEVADRKRGAVRERLRAKLPDRKAAGLVMAKALVVEAVTGKRATFVVVETSQPGARVLVDGVNKGNTPLVLTDIQPGPHELRVEPENAAPLFRRIDVKKGKTTEVAMVITARAPDEKDAASDPQTAPKPDEDGGAEGDGGFPLYPAILGVAGAGTLIFGLNALAHGIIGGYTINASGRPSFGDAMVEARPARDVNDVVFWYLFLFQPRAPGNIFVSDDDRAAYFLWRGAAASIALAGGVVLSLAGLGLLGGAAGVWSLNE